MAWWKVLGDQETTAYYCALPSAGIITQYIFSLKPEFLYFSNVSYFDYAALYDWF